jgi:hypothetical protein
MTHFMDAEEVPVSLKVVLQGFACSDFQKCLRQLYTLTEVCDC